MDPSQQSRQPFPGPLGPRGFLAGIQIRPIIAGAVVDYVATLVIITVYVILYSMNNPGEKGGVSEEAFEKGLEQMLSSQEGLFAVIAIGALCTVLGGYVAGRMAKSEEPKHGALVGVVSLVIGILQVGMAGEPSPLPYWHQLLGYILAVPAGALGGSFAEGKSKLSMPRGTQ